ncbi:MAG TPA: dTMP kinase [Holophaga sp.]|nr:dTMP kinase [Holophaga sp.]
MLITLEGVEGSGKSTQVRRLADRLAGAGLPPVVSKEPGGTALGRELRTLLLAPHASGEAWCPKAELLLFYADRAQHLAALVRPALEAGRVVLVDRFEDSSWAYQGALGVADEDLARLRAVVLGDFKPSLTLVLDLDPEASLERVGTRNAGLGTAFRETRYDQEALGFHKQVRRRFKEIAAREPERVVLVDAGGPADEVEKAIWARVEAFLSARGFKVG